MNRTNLALIGMMGTYKSSAGKALARERKLRFVDSDSFIERQTGQTVAELFDKLGEEGFRRIEAEAVRTLAARSHTVISCGGGVPLRGENVAALKQSSTVVLLCADAQTIFSRIGDPSTRPLLAGKFTVQRIRDLMAAREACYRAAADLIVDNTGMTSGETAQKILQELAKIHCQNGTDIV